MLAHANLSKTLWVDALMTTTYVINRSPSAPLDGDVPQRVWTGKDVSYRHLKVFGCLAYVHVAKDKWGKLDLKTRPCIFLGYGDDEEIDPTKRHETRERKRREMEKGATELKEADKVKGKTRQAHLSSLLET